MRLEFDEHGFLPSGIYELSISELEYIFVEESHEKEHRRKLFKQYLLHVEEIEQKLGFILFQFINGSFVTKKKKPNDIDVVTFLDYRLFRKTEISRMELTERWNNISEIDGYIVPRSYPGHPFFIQSQLSNI